MLRRIVLIGFFLLFAGPLFAQTAVRKPNIILIIADDLGYGDVGAYGQKMIKTPNIDRMAAEGTKFTQFYAGSTVCAPSRCALMTGLTTGHCVIRGNAKVDLRPTDVTIPEVMKTAGYTNGMVGKWGLGAEGTTGAPTNQGLDFFYGFIDQTMAHNSWPSFLVRNDQRVKLNNVVPNEGRYGQGVASEKNDFAPALMQAEALKFIEANKDRPFFLNISNTLPHANNEARITEVPDYGIYKEMDWPESQKAYAAAVTLLDAYVGQVMDKIKSLGLENDTLILFTSDNGTHQEGANNATFFNSSGPLRGMKRDMYEGGIRVPLIARWPGKVAAGKTDETVWAMWDFLPTFAELAGAAVTAPTDGISFAPTLLGQTQARQHEYLYWEFHEGGFSQAIRAGDWKIIRSRSGTELYNLKEDLGETRNIAEQNQQVVERLSRLLTSSRTDSADFPVRN
jgi:arylsulfatase A-like enzyme